MLKMTNWTIWKSREMRKMTRHFSVPWRTLSQHWQSCDKNRRGMEKYAAFLQLLKLPVWNSNIRIIIFRFDTNPFGFNVLVCFSFSFGTMKNVFFLACAFNYHLIFWLRKRVGRLTRSSPLDCNGSVLNYFKNNFKLYKTSLFHLKIWKKFAFQFKFPAII